MEDRRKEREDGREGKNREDGRERKEREDRREEQGGTKKERKR